MQFKVTHDKSSWLGQVGEHVRDEENKVVLRMAGSRLVEFEKEHVERTSKAAPEKAVTPSVEDAASKVAPEKAVSAPVEKRSAKAK